MAAPAAPVVAVPAAPVAAPWAVRYANFAALDAALTAAQPRYAANSAIAVAPGVPFQQKWQTAMTANGTHFVLGNAAGEQDSIAVLVLLLKQLGIYNGVVMRRLEHGGAADAATGATAALPAVPGGLLGNEANNPLSADAIALIVDHALKCWNDHAADACNDFIGDVKTYINDKLTRHPQAGTMADAWKRGLVDATIRLHNLTNGLPAPVPAHPAADPLNTLPNPPFGAADAFGQAAVPTFGGAAAKKSKKTAKKAVKSRKAGRKAVRKAVRKTAKRTASRKAGRKVGRKTVRKVGVRKH